MKKFLVVIIIAAISCSIVACKKEIKKDSLTDKEIIALTKDLGKIHNQALDNIARNISEISKKYPRNMRNARTSVYQEQLDEIGRTVLDETIETVDEGYSSTYTLDRVQGINFIKEAVFEVNDASIYTITTQIQNNTLVVSSELENKVYQINSLIENANSSTELNQQLDNFLNNQIGNLQTEEEKLAFSAGISVAKSSYEYWSNQQNLDYWNTFSEAPNNPYARTMRMNPINGKDVAKADFNGAVSGAITGAKYGFTATAAGGGVGGGIAGGVLGGAIGAIGMSTVNGLKQAFGVTTPWWLEWTGL